MSTLHTLHQETEQARALLANFADILGDDAEARADAVEGETSLHEAMAAAVARLTELEGLTDGPGEMMVRLELRASRLKKQAENIRTALCVAMEAASIKKLELPTATVSLRAVPAKVEIIDESQIASRWFVEQPPKLDRKAILAALRDKQVVTGAQLSNGGMTISFGSK
ncbi:MAG: siphovirus Gp157 family protein [Hyphomicrobium sp.]